MSLIDLVFVTLVVCSHVLASFLVLLLYFVQVPGTSIVLNKANSHGYRCCYFSLDITIIDCLFIKLTCRHHHHYGVNRQLM